MGDLHWPSLRYNVLAQGNLLVEVIMNHLDSSNCLQHRIELIFLSLKFAVATDVLLTDEDVGNTSLAGDFFESVLEGGTVF